MRGEKILQQKSYNIHIHIKPIPETHPMRRQEVWEKIKRYTKTKLSLFWINFNSPWRNVPFWELKLTCLHTRWLILDPTSIATLQSWCFYLLFKYSRQNTHLKNKLHPLPHTPPPPPSSYCRAFTSTCVGRLLFFKSHLSFNDPRK